MFDYTPPVIPPAVVEYVDKNMVQNPGGGKIIYVMRLGTQKIYCAYLYHNIDQTNQDIINGPAIFAFSRKTVHKIDDMDEYFHVLEVKNKYYKKRSKHCYNRLNKNLIKNANKTLVMEDNSLPPNIPMPVIEYTNKYILKHKNKKIDYIFDWKGKHFYRVCYQIRPRCSPHKKIILSYDGRTVRMLTDNEINELAYNYSDNYYYMLFAK